MEISYLMPLFPHSIHIYGRSPLINQRYQPCIHRFRLRLTVLYFYFSKSKSKSKFIFIFYFFFFSAKKKTLKLKLYFTGKWEQNLLTLEWFNSSRWPR